jgi:hypothetical protein
VFLGLLFYTSPSLAGQDGMGQALLALLALAVPGGFAAGSVVLGSRLTAVGGRRAWLTAIVLEGFMTCFGFGLFAVAPIGGGGPVLVMGIPGLAGAVWSAHAVYALWGQDARRYCGAPLRG